MSESLNFSFRHVEEDEQPALQPLMRALTGRTARPVGGDQVVLYDWPMNDLKTLCTRVKEASLRMPRSTTIIYTKTETRMDWSQVAFDDHTAEECRIKWQQLSANVRNFRTISEIITDTERWLDSKPRRAKQALADHPDKPSKPATIFIRYMIAELPQLKAQYPNLSHREIIRKIGEMYKSLPPAKIDQLKASWLAEQEEYTARLEKFYAAHPEAAPYTRQTNTSLAGHKPETGFMLFAAEKAKDPKFANATKEELRTKWVKLKDQKKVTYIEAALMANQQNESQSLTMMPKAKCDILTKDEREVYDRFLGKPTRPPQTGFALFKSIASVELKDLSTAERNKEFHERWSLMSRAEQSKFNNEIKLMKQTFDHDMTEYLKKLKQREQLLMENRPGISAKMSQALTNGQSLLSLPKRPRLPSESTYGAGDNSLMSLTRSPTKNESSSALKDLKFAGVKLTSPHSDQESADDVNAVTAFPSKQKSSEDLVAPTGKVSSPAKDQLTSPTKRKLSNTIDTPAKIDHTKVTALRCYQESELENWREVNPDLSDKKLLKSIAAAFEELPEKKKAKWARRAEKRLRKMSVGGV
ncbi:nucleolar transcription factor 1-like [Tropilaelaps mercedesae]|uniref:Nucleolar transcription factor 1-like n=1 Tax=Tropilaelaps mercedesae TaxID=418985 RepID=A0A1V9X597_9ACAR|nr:nucleolar transcription factor 1-like [Tropilaelaps mercedesae]